MEKDTNSSFDENLCHPPAVQDSAARDENEDSMELERLNAGHRKAEAEKALEKALKAQQSAARAEGKPRAGEFWAEYDERTGVAQEARDKAAQEAKEAKKEAGHHTLEKQQEQTASATGLKGNKQAQEPGLGGTARKPVHEIGDPANTTRPIIPPMGALTDNPDIAQVPTGGALSDNVSMRQPPPDGRYDPGRRREIGEAGRHFMTSRQKMHPPLMSVLPMLPHEEPIDKWPFYPERSAPEEIWIRNGWIYCGVPNNTGPQTDPTALLWNDTSVLSKIGVGGYNGMGDYRFVYMACSVDEATGKTVMGYPYNGNFATYGCWLDVAEGATYADALKSIQKIDRVCFPLCRFVVQNHVVIIKERIFRAGIMHVPCHRTSPKNGGGDVFHASLCFAPKATFTYTYGEAGCSNITGATLELEHDF